MRDERSAGDDGLGAGGALPDGARSESADGELGELIGLAAFAGTGLAEDASAVVVEPAEAVDVSAEAVEAAAVTEFSRAAELAGSGVSGPAHGTQEPYQHGESGGASDTSGASGKSGESDKQAAQDPAGLLPESEVFIEIPADRLYVVLARSAAVHLGSVLHLGITDVTDLRLAVDEACALFLLHPAFPDGREVGLACRFEAYREELRVTVRAPVPAGFAPDTEAIGWIMLGALVDDLAWTRQDGYGTLTLTKRFEPAPSP
jgi:serine/threonine-protein kinase RsbW